MSKIRKTKSIIEEHIITSYEAYNYVKKQTKNLFNIKFKYLKKMWKIEDIIIKERRNRQPKITDFISKTRLDD